MTTIFLILFNYYTEIYNKSAHIFYLVKSFFMLFILDVSLF